MFNMARAPLSLHSPVSLVCHDAGAANLIFAWIREWAEKGLLDQYEFRLFIKGPAEKAWQLEPVPLLQMQLHT